MMAAPTEVVCPSIVLSFDIGSTSVRCFAFRIHPDSEPNFARQLLSFSKVLLCHDVVQPLSSGLRTATGSEFAGEPKVESLRKPAGFSAWGTFDPEAVYDAATSAAESCLRDAGESLASKNIIICATGFVGNVMLVDAHGNACTELFSYALHGEEAAAAEESINSRAERSSLHNETGAPTHTAYAPCALELLRGRSGGKLPQGLHMTTIYTYILARWCGCAPQQLGISVSEAAWAGLIDFSTGTWSARTLHLLDLPDSYLPTLRVDTHKLPHPTAVPFLNTLICPFEFGGSVPNLWLNPCIGDGAAAVIASGACAVEGEHASFSLTIGTSAAIRTRIAISRLATMICTCKGVCACGLPALSSLGLWCYAISNKEALLGAALNDAGSLIEFCEKQLGISIDTFDSQELIKPSTVSCLPTFSGERSTGWRSRLRGGFFNTDLETKGEDLMQACCEAVGFRLRYFLQVLCQVTGTPEGKAVVVLSGAAMEKPTKWREIIGEIVQFIFDIMHTCARVLCWK
jgi:gluconokinase